MKSLWLNCCASFWASAEGSEAATRCNHDCKSHSKPSAPIGPIPAVQWAQHFIYSSSTAWLMRARACMRRCESPMISRLSGACKGKGWSQQRHAWTTQRQSLTSYSCVSRSYGSATFSDAQCISNWLTPLHTPRLTHISCSQPWLAACSTTCLRMATCLRDSSHSLINKRSLIFSELWMYPAPHQTSVSRIDSKTYGCAVRTLLHPPTF